MPRVLYRRRFAYRRRRNPLSTRNIYGRTSARSQSYQIAALRSRVSRLNRKVKPEKKTFTSSPSTLPLSSEAGGQVAITIAPPIIPQGASPNQRVGEKIYRRDTYYISLEYFNNSSTGFHDTESSGVQCRYIIGRYRTNVNTTLVPGGSELISQYATSGSAYTISAIQPLKDGITTRYKIFKDKTFYMEVNRNQKMLKVKTPWYVDRYYSDSGTNTDKHSFFFILASGLHWDTNFTETIPVTYNCKTVFTDL